MGVVPVIRVKGGNPRVLCWVNRSAISAVGTWSDQYESGDSDWHFLRMSLIVRMVRSTCPLARLLPTVIRLWAMPDA